MAFIHEYTKFENLATQAPEPMGAETASVY